MIIISCCERIFCLLTNYLKKQRSRRCNLDENEEVLPKWSSNQLIVQKSQIRVNLLRVFEVKKVKDLLFILGQRLVEIHILDRFRDPPRAPPDSIKISWDTTLRHSEYQKNISWLFLVFVHQMKMSYTSWLMFHCLQMWSCPQYAKRDLCSLSQMFFLKTNFLDMVCSVD